MEINFPCVLLYLVWKLDQNLHMENQSNTMHSVSCYYRKIAQRDVSYVD